MSTFLTDPFSGSGPPDASKWAAIPGGFTEFSGVGDLTQSGGVLTLSPQTGAGEMWTVNATPLPDASISADVSWPAGGTHDSSANAYIGIRMQQVSAHLSGYFVALSNHASGGATTGIDYVLAKRDLSGSDNFIFASGGTLNALSGTFKVAITGSTLELFVNGVSVYSTTDSTIATAGHGLIAADGSSNAHGAGFFAFDNVDIEAATPTDFWTNFVLSEEIV